MDKLVGSSTPKTDNGSERVVEGRDDNVCITIDEIMEGISYADQSSGI